jgi:xanthine dehydrogenase/oxidase
VDFLRKSRRLTGTKLGCGEGGCGACTVAFEMTDKATGQMTTRSVNACMQLVCALDGVRITTIEGLGGRDTGYHPLQKKVADCDGSQCGFCTPGQVMSMFAVLSNDAVPSAKAIEESFDGNLCRCTGYRPILQSFRQFADGQESMGELPSKPKSAAPTPIPMKSLRMVDSHSDHEYIRVLTLAELFPVWDSLLEAGRIVELVCGNTGRIGVAKYFRHAEEPMWPATVERLSLVDISKIPDMNRVETLPSGLCVGACVSIAELIEILTLGGGSAYVAAARHLKQVAGTQVRNAGSWGGNLVMSKDRARFPSDVRTVLATLNAQLIVASKNGGHDVMKMRDFLGHNMERRVLVSVHIPKHPDSVVVKTFRTAVRHCNARWLSSFLQTFLPLPSPPFYTNAHQAFLKTFTFLTSIFLYILASSHGLPLLSFLRTYLQAQS